MFRQNKQFASVPKLTRNLALVVALIGLASAVIAQTSAGFTPTGNMTTSRGAHAATLLFNGKVLIAGGQQGSAGLANAELYDPATGTFIPTGNMATARVMGSATLLADGRVLIVGGTGNTPTTAELYDPSTETFTATGGMITANGIATLLGNGKVLITGNTAQLYDPATATFSPTGAYAGAFPYPETATVLQDGRVLIVGNADNSSGYIEHEELYDPVTGTFKLTGKMHTVGFGSDIWAGHTATLLPNGKVLLAGGTSEDFGYFRIAELYDPSTDTFTATANMTIARAGHTATLLPDGTVLLAGGQYIGSIISAELYNPATGTFSEIGAMTTGRFWQSATLLRDGTVLIAGGFGPPQTSSAELYHPAAVQGTPTVQIVDNNTGSLTTLAVGDSFSFQVTGAPPHSLVSVSEAGWSASVGYTDASGLFWLNGIVASNVVGTWQQTWTIGGVLDKPGPLQFTITPKP
jgi:hypothetical protein